MKRVRNEMGLTNVELMIPFVRTLGQAEAVVNLLAKNGLVRGENGLRLIMMCEVPSNAILAEQFLEFFDGFSIGSNDLTQLTLGLDRDSGMELLAKDFDERDPAVKALLSMAIKPRASTSASAARVHRTILISRSGWWKRASSRCRSILTR
jgi:pyruvate,water dikinase